MATGVSLTLYLPSNKVSSPPAYAIDEVSLKTPINSNETLIQAAPEQEQKYALQLGLYSNLRHAVSQAKQFTLNSQIHIMTIEDGKHLWHLLLLGPYDSQSDAVIQLTDLDEDLQTRISIVRWPKSEKGSQS